VRLAVRAGEAVDDRACGPTETRFRNAGVAPARDGVPGAQACREIAAVRSGPAACPRCATRTTPVASAAVTATDDTTWATRMARLWHL
jgi:hypothetical protein